MHVVDVTSQSINMLNPMDGVEQNLFLVLLPQEEFLRLEKHQNGFYTTGASGE